MTLAQVHFSPDNVISSNHYQYDDATDMKGTQDAQNNDIRLSKIICSKLRMTESLNNNLLAKRWDDALDMINASYDLARTANEYGDLPLHTALWIGAPRSVISTLIETFEGAVRTPNKRLWLPLHIAISFGNSVSTVKLLLNRFPSSLYHRNLEGKTPYDLVAEKKRKSASLWKSHILNGGVR